MIICATANDNKSLEKAGDICQVKIIPFLRASNMLIDGIRFAENGYTLAADKKKIKDCKSKEYKIFIKRIADSLQTSVELDCRILFEYSLETESSKLNYCWKI
jgi:hypothetical protein